jgi:hypothetical protein
MRLLPPDDLTLFRCSVGHTLSAEELLEAQADQLETALWSAVRIAEQQTALAKILGRPDPVEDPAAPPTLPLAAGSEETAAAIRCILEGGAAGAKRTC